LFVLAEERVKDKLAAAAREKIAAVAREKQLQLERKRRAAAFLNMIRKDHPLGTDLPVIGNVTISGCSVICVTSWMLCFSLCPKGYNVLHYVK
jgi:hypothetical protein